MRVLLSTYDSRGGVEPLVALAVQLRALGAAHDGPAPTTVAATLLLDAISRRKPPVPA